MSELIESIEQQIDADKEVITVLPRNGIKAIKTLLKTIEDTTQKYEHINKMLLKEIENRYNEFTDVELNEELPNLEQEILKLDVAIKNIDTRSSFEKMQLDRIVYNINGYYKSNLERLNKELIDCVEQFERVGIKITAEDFNISEYAKEYMVVLLAEAHNGEVNSEKIKDTFEKVYLKCSDVIQHLYVNIRLIYDKYEYQIDKFFENKIEKLMKDFNSTPDQVEDTKIALICKKKKIEETDEKIILDKFFSGELNINDYKEQNYNKIYSDLVSKDISDFSFEIIEKLNDNLNEYISFTKYKFLLDGVLKIREEVLKQNGNTEFKVIKDKINNMATNIFKMNERIKKPARGLFGIKPSAKNNISIIIERDNLVLELKKLYMQLDDEIIKQRVMENIDETSSMLDVLKLGSYHYGFMAKEIINQYPEITDKELSELANKIRDFITFSSFNVINYIRISDKKEISVIIKDKYKLFGMELSVENFEEGSVEDLMKKVKILINYNNILKSKISIKDIEYILAVKELLKK